jgi:general stress protein 26
MTTGEIDTRFGHPDAQAPSWDEVERLLGEAELYWISTVRADGRPHVVPLVGVWHDGAFAFCTGRSEQKVRNLESGNAVAVTTGTNTWQAGTDVVLEGHAERVLGRDRLEPLAAAWRAKYGDDWAWSADDETFVDGDGSRPWVYVVRPEKVIVFAKDPHGQTTYRF